MSVSVTTENVFLTALQPNSTVSTYAVPSENELAHGGSHQKDQARFKRVHQQVTMRLAEKSTLPRQNGSSSQYAASESGDYSTMTKFSTMSQNFPQNFSSKSYSPSRSMMAQRPSQYSSGGFSSRSAIDFAPKGKMSYTAGGGVGGGGAYYQEEVVGGGYQAGGYQAGGYQAGGYQTGGYQTGGYQAGGYQAGCAPAQLQQVGTMTRSFSRMGGDPETMSMHSMRMSSIPRQVTNSWVGQDDSDGSLASERDATYTKQASVSNGYAKTFPRQSMYATSRVNGQQQVSSMTLPVIKRSISGTLATGGGGGMEQEVYVSRQSSYKGPAHRTINRINNRQSVRTSSVSSSGMYGSAGGFNGSQGNIALVQQGRLSRAGSVRSMHSVGKGKDVYDGMDFSGSMGNLSGLDNLDMATAMNYLDQSDYDLQMLGAAYIQHECYHNNDAKKTVNTWKGIPRLVKLFNSDNEEVKRYATGATRNLIYENMENKVALIEAGGIPKLIQALNKQDDELCKNITGILWNLSSKDNLKERLARETLPDLTEKILIPLSGTGEEEIIELTASESDIFNNTTGCLRNLSSVNEKTRQQMRDTSGLIDALVGYIKTCLSDTRVEEKGVENAVCVLRNLSYQLYNEIPTTALVRLEGPSRAEGSSKGEAIGCFTPNSKKAKDSQNQDLRTFSEVSREPKGMECLWHPNIVDMYNQLLLRCEINSTTREAAAGALQNITAGDRRWASILSRVALEQNRMLPVILDQLKTQNDVELRSLTGFLRNLSRHAIDKNVMATKCVGNLVEKLPSNGREKVPSSEVVLNICGALNNLVTSSIVAARDICFFDGLPKLVAIKNEHDGSLPRAKAAKAAGTVLCNMFQYRKLHKDYKAKGFLKEHFSEF